MNNNPTRLSVKIAAVCVVIAFTCVAIEALSWAAYLTRDYIGLLVRDVLPPNELQLDPYEMADPENAGHWRLRPGYDASIDKVIAGKKASNKWLGIKALREVNNAPKGNKNLAINSAGFKGDEIEATHRCPRILAIGDSVTFGLGAISYPLFMSQYFARENIGVEVVNGGVEGYAPRNALLELNAYTALKPEIIVIYLGWNAMFLAANDASMYDPTFKTLWLLRRIRYVISKLFSNQNAVASAQFKRQLNAISSDPEIARWRQLPTPFLPDVIKLVSELRKTGAEVYVVNLFGLYQSDRQPSEKALSIGHLPLAMDNSFSFAAMTDRYNEDITTLVGKAGAKVIDFQAWGRQNLQPPEAYFFDSVHFNSVGLERVGAFLAQQLVQKVKALPKHCSLEGK